MEGGFQYWQRKREGRFKLPNQNDRWDFTTHCTEIKRIGEYYKQLCSSKFNNRDETPRKP